MTTYNIPPTGTVNGSARSDVFIVDPDTLISATIRDTGGASDTMLVYDRPGRTAGEFLVSGGYIIWRNCELDQVKIKLNADGTSPVEFFKWQRLAEDGNPYVHINHIVLPGQSILYANSSVLGTTGADRITAPHFATFVNEWGEIYGNSGNDTLTASDSYWAILYGGRGNDLLVGKGDVDDDFTGDAGADTLKGGLGDDALDGGTSADEISGGAGEDQIIGGGGSDTMSGGAGADAFIYNMGERGHDLIADYGRGGDHIEINNLDREDLTIRQSGEDAVITMPNGAQITVADTAVAGLDLIFT